MKKKNGFIAISLLYSFFLIFIILIIAILNNYSENRITNSIIMEDAKTFLQGSGDWGINGKAGNYVMNTWDENEMIQMNISKTITFNKTAPYSDTYHAEENNNILSRTFTISGTNTKITYANDYSHNGQSIILNEPITNTFSSVYTTLDGKIVPFVGVSNAPEVVAGSVYRIVSANYNSGTNTATIAYKVIYNVPDNNDLSNVGIFTTVDNYGISYYVRGSSDYNYVYFANHYWRIVRINGDGSIRLVYQGPEYNSNGILPYKYWYNETPNRNEYLGYKYKLGEINGVDTDSNIKYQIDRWYETNIKDQVYEDYLSDAIFCNNRTGGAIGNTNNYYDSYNRLYFNSPTAQIINPSVICENKLDSFTVADTSISNGALTYPIGTLTIDEIVMAGAYLGQPNAMFYLKTDEAYMTMSPAQFIDNVASVYVLDATGNYIIGSIRSKYGVRPVINISKDVTLLGTGTIASPFTINE